MILNAMANSVQIPLTERLPEVRGRYSEGTELSKLTWFRVGGPAEVLFRPADQEDLSHFLKAKPADTPLVTIGVGSNLLVRDGGIDGVTLRLGPAFAGIRCEGSHVFCGAADLDLNVAVAAQKAGLAGLEFLSGIPGSIGGALRMNAGAYHRETKDVLVWAEALDPQGELHRLMPNDLGYAYRHCGLPEDWIFLRACLRAEPGDPKQIGALMSDIKERRSQSQPIRSRTGGSTFKNPEGKKAWQLIDSAGCRGLRHGGAEVSQQHCNFLINTGEASAADLEGLGEAVRQSVKEKSGVQLEWEIRRLGRAQPAAPLSPNNGGNR
ncbi:MAG: UDP-N-acetylmuramate dehydrogenase [Pseudomonadota bacterium]